MSKTYDGLIRRHEQLLKGFQDWITKLQPTLGTSAAEIREERRKQAAVITTFKREVKAVQDEIRAWHAAPGPGTTEIARIQREHAAAIKKLKDAEKRRLEEEVKLMPPAQRRRMIRVVKPRKKP